MLDYLPHITAALLDTLIIVVFIPWVLLTKKDPMAALAWCLVVFLVPLLGGPLFWMFGYNHVHRPLLRKQRHRSRFRASHPPRQQEAKRGDHAEHATDDLGQLALKLNAFPVSHGNAVTLYADTQHAYDAICDAVGAARRHVHLEYFIFRHDAAGSAVLDLLTEKAKQGVEVRLLFDSMGTRHLKRRHLAALRAAGGQASAFLPLNPLRSRMQINLRNHRKLTIVDGRVGFLGGMNIGNEYLGKDPYFGYWRDEMLRLEGPAVSGVQRIFAEDWDFAVHEPLDADTYFPELPPAGESVVQLIESGPDQERNAIRETYFAAILSARDRLWMASPYFVPDAGLLDALRLARYRGVDVRLLSLGKPDHFFSFYAGRYYWNEMLATGMKVYQYRKGMMHSKVMLVDGRWGMVSSANLDNRSLHLNFEAGCIVHSPDLVADLERQYGKDLEDATPLDPVAFARRPFRSRLVDNACRLLSPVL